MATAEDSGLAETRTTTLNEAQLARRIEIGEERRARTRQRLMEAAYRLFAERGAEAPTIDDVIAEAAVARGTFYNHFKTRDELFRAVASDIADAINTLIAQALDPVTDPARRLALAFRMFVRFALADAARGWILLRTIPLIGPLNANMKSHIYAEFGAAIASGRLPDQALDIAVDLGIGLQMMTIHRLLVEPDGPPIEAAAAAVLAALGLDKAEAWTIAHEPIRVLDDEPLQPAA